MQTKKLDIRKVILEVSRTEFLAKGFKDASMRTISKKADVGLSNIYNYFKNKDEIFEGVVAIPLRQLKKMNKMFMDDYFFDLKNMSNQKIGRLKLLYSIKFINKYRDELILLFFKSYGSSLQNFKDNWIDESTEVSLKWINKYNKIHNKNIKTSEFFIHYINSSFVTFVSELLMHNIEKKNMENYLKEYFEFYGHGWMETMK